MQPRMTSLLCLKRSLALRSSTFNSARLSQQRFFSSTHLRCFQIPSSGLRSGASRASAICFCFQPCSFSSKARRRLPSRQLLAWLDKIFSIVELIIPTTLDFYAEIRKFDFEIDFSNGGGLQGQGFRLDIEGEDISDEKLARYVVEDMRLLMVEEVRILNKEIIAENHKRLDPS